MASALLPRAQRRVREVNEAVIRTSLTRGDTRGIRGGGYLRIPRNPAHPVHQPLTIIPLSRSLGALHMLALLKTLRRRFQSRPSDHYADSYTYLVAKRSATWPFNGLMRKLTGPDGLHVAEGLYSQIDRIRGDLVTRLAGQQVRTSFRHQNVDMDAGECVAGVSSPEAAARLVYGLVRMFKPSRVIEIGSAFGIGTMYIAEALRMNGKGEVIGIEYEHWRADIANACLAKHWLSIARVEKGAAEDVFPRLRGQYGAFDFALVDAVHKFDNTVGYHDMLSSTSSPSTIAVFDDINWSEEMGHFWGFLCRQNQVSDALLVNGRWGLVRYGPRR